ncbi:MAG: ATP-binding protein, partial [Clostridiales bacterium]|nr:ATP-binding protein [Clostridiales bacterium]
LATFLRLGLHSGKNIVKVREELEHVKCYLQIEKERFPDLFDVRYEIDEKILDYDMVKVILQPIVENSIKHGFDNIDYKGLIVIKGYERDESIMFEIEDNGIGMKWDGDLTFPQSDNPLGGYGLYNIDRRLSIYYESDYSFEFCSEPKKGTIVRFKIGKEIKKY